MSFFMRFFPATILSSAVESIVLYYVFSFIFDFQISIPFFGNVVVLSFIIRLISAVALTRIRSGMFLVLDFLSISLYCNIVLLPIVYILSFSFSNGRPLLVYGWDVLFILLSVILPSFFIWSTVLYIFHRRTVSF